MIQRYLIAGLLTLSVLLGAFSYFQYERRGVLTSQLTVLQDQLNTAVHARAAAEYALADQAKQLQRLRTTTAKRQKDLTNAVQSDPVWATTPVPPGIHEWLRDQGHIPDFPAEQPATGLPAP